MKLPTAAEIQAMCAYHRRVSAYEAKNGTGYENAWHVWRWMLYQSVERKI